MRIYALLLLLAFAAQPAPAEVSEALTYRTYEVNHKPGQRLLDALNAASPILQDGKIFHGHTEWRVTWRFWRAEQPDRTCSITIVKTAASGSITLPQLASTDKNVLSQFAEYIAALRSHELGHFKFGTDAAHEIERRISSLPGMASCSTLESEANRVGYQTLEEFKSSENVYDETTQHGKSQGAWLPR